MGVFARGLGVLILITASLQGQVRTAPPSIYNDAGRGMMWTEQMKSRLKYKAAVQYCAALRLGGYSDWRTPTIDELDTVTSGYSYNKLEARGKKADSHPATGIELAWGKTPENGVHLVVDDAWKQQDGHGGYRFRRTRRLESHGLLFLGRHL